MSKRILVVDDDPNIRRLVTLALTDDSAYTVHAVSSGEAALLHISRNPIDLLFTDIRMPGMSGIELVRRVRELDLQTPVILFTVSPQDLLPQEAQRLKIDCLLEKPVSPDQLRIAVDLLLDPSKLLPTKPAPPEPARTTAHPPPVTSLPAAVRTAAAASTGPLTQRLAQIQQKRETTPLPAQTAPIAMRVTPGGRSGTGRNYSEHQIEAMRLALKELVLSPDVVSAVLADMSGIVLTHWSRHRDINVTVVAALAAGNSLALAEISRNLGQQQPGNLVIHEGQDQSILMAQMADLLLLIAVGPNASLGWARIAILRACEEVLRIAQS